MTHDVTLLWILVVAVFGVGITISVNDNSSTTPTTATTPTTTTPQICNANKSCEECIKSASCYYCYKGNTCRLYPAGKVLPPSSECPLEDARWGISCSINFKVVIIAMSCVAGVLIIFLTCCIYCCCCRSKKANKRLLADEAKYDRQKQERKVKGEERRAERKTRTDEIRQKYGIPIDGLVKDDNPYKRFDA